MHALALWAGFFGAWALVAGPVYQAMLELRAEDIQTDRLRALSVKVPPSPPPTRWWLLLPPVYFLLRHRRKKSVQSQWLELMADPDFEALTQFSNKAAAWVMVGFGGLMIAFKETAELAEGNEWPVVAFVIVVGAMLALSVGFGVSRLRWMDRQQKKRQARSAQKEPAGTPHGTGSSGETAAPASATSR